MHDGNAARGRLAPARTVRPILIPGVVVVVPLCVFFGRRVGRKIRDYQQTIVQAVKGGWHGGSSRSDGSHQWTFSGAFLYSLTVITTIGEWTVPFFCVLVGSGHAECEKGFMAYAGVECY